MPRAKKSTSPAVEILKAYNAGATLADLKAKYGIGGKAQLAKAVLEAMITMGKVPALTRGRKKAEAPAEFKVAVNKRGTIILHKDAVVDAFKLKTGQSFTARKRGMKIILTRVGEAKPKARKVRGRGRKPTLPADVAQQNTAKE